MEFLGSSRRDIRSLPVEARNALGNELRNVQRGETPLHWKPMNSVGPGVIEIRVHVGGAFRLLYIATFVECIYVLHVFQKKSQKTSRLDLAVARARLATVRRSSREV